MPKKSNIDRYKWNYEISIKKFKWHPDDYYTKERALNIWKQSRDDAIEYMCELEDKYPYIAKNRDKLRKEVDDELKANKKDGK